jgi:hypothetical protein
MKILTSLLAGVMLSAAIMAHPGSAATPSRPISGYRCMMLNLTEQQTMDPSVHVPFRASPSETAPPVGWAGSVVAVRESQTPVNGFVRALFPTGQEVWIAADKLRPYHSLGDPSAKCVPVVLPSGKIGFGSPS